MPNIKRGMMGAAGVTGATGNDLYGWGGNYDGQLGLEVAGGAGSRSSPIQIGGSEWTMIGAGNRTTHAIKGDDSLHCMGWNGTGVVGDGTVISRSSPVQIGSLSWAWVSGGSDHSTGVTTDSKLYTWGDSGSGELGNNQAGADASAPVQVGSLTTWLRSSSGQDHTVALKTDGTIWSFGLNTSGQLGHGDTVSVSSPVQIGSVDTWADVQAGANFTSALKDDGTLWTTGSSSYGQLGHGNATNLSSLTQVGSLTTWAKISVTANYTIAITTAGTLFAFGSSGNGAMGDGEDVNRSSPVQIGALTTWSKLFLGFGGAAVMAIKTDGTLWAWGGNGEGQMGMGDRGISRSSPVQVGSETDWLSGTHGNEHVMGIREA
jgi:alpha-tubulin suppressor-like RCC1 family protein